MQSYLWKLWLAPGSGQEVERISVSISHMQQNNMLFHIPGKYMQWADFLFYVVLSTTTHHRITCTWKVLLTKQVTRFGVTGLCWFIKLREFHRDKSLLIKFSKFVWLFANSPLLSLLSGSWSTRLTPFQKPQLLKSSVVVCSLTERIQNVQFSSQMDLKLKVKTKQIVADKEINY